MINHVLRTLSVVFNVKKNTKMKDSVIITTPEQLHALINSAVEANISKLANLIQQKVSPDVDRLSLSDAVVFLNEQGLIITRSTLYNLVFKRAIPFSKCGKRTIFSKKELLQWLEIRTVRPAVKSDAVLALANRVKSK